MGSLSFTASESVEESIRLFHLHYQNKNDTTLSQTLSDLLQKAIEYWDIIQLIENNPDLRLSLEAEAKARAEKTPPIYS